MALSRSPGFSIKPLAPSRSEKKPCQRWIERRCHRYVNDHGQVREGKPVAVLVRRLFADARRAAVLANLSEVNGNAACSRLIGSEFSGRRQHRSGRGSCREPLARERSGYELRQPMTPLNGTRTVEPEPAGTVAVDLWLFNLRE
jgi:hypothetical protein